MPWSVLFRAKNIGRDNCVPNFLQDYYEIGRSVVDMFYIWRMFYVRVDTPSVRVSIFIGIKGI